MRILRGSLYAMIAVVVGIGALFLGACFTDGPLAMIPGGPLSSGEWAAEPVSDWSFAADVEEIELQLVSQRRSRTTWIVVHQGRAYIPVSLSFPPGKSWHLEADQRGAAVLRIEGQRYPVELTRVKDEAQAAEVFPALREKYTPPPGGSEAWLFEIRSRPGTGS